MSTADSGREVVLQLGGEREFKNWSPQIERYSMLQNVTRGNGLGLVLLHDFWDRR